MARRRLASISLALGQMSPRYTSLPPRSEEHTSELQSQSNLVCRLLLEKKKSLAMDRDRVRNCFHFVRMCLGDVLGSTRRTACDADGIGGIGSRTAGRRCRE